MQSKPALPRRLLLAAPIAFGLCLAACQEEAVPSAAMPGAPAKAEVGVVTLHPVSAPVVMALPGRTVASAVAEIRPQVAGIVEARLFREGGEVAAGDPLYSIEASSYEAALAAAEASRQKAEASLAGAKARSERYTRLARISGVSEQDLEDAKATELEAAADLAAAEAQVKAARINLDHTTVTAPISGQIGVSTVTAGALVTASQSDALATIRQLDPIYVDLTDSSTNMLKIRRMLRDGSLQGDRDAVTVTLTLDDGSRYDETGTIESTEATVSTTTGSFTLRTRFANPQRLLLPGMYVRAEVRLGTIENAFLVPQRAVGRNAKGEATAIFVTADGTAETRIIAADRSTGNDWIVTEGIPDGARLVVEGGESLRDGAEVTAVDVTLDPATGLVQDAAADDPAPATVDAAPATAK
jgi:RND family efflux transporter, MFP subunit